MTRILMVHGRAQQGRSAEAVRDEWLRSLRLGLGAQAPVLDDVQVDVPFYGDHLDELMRQLGSTIPEDLLARGDVVGAEDDFLRFQAEIFDEVRRREDVTDDQVAAEMDGVVERGPLNWFWVRAIMKTLNRVPGIDGNMIERFTSDVWFYLTRSRIRREINAIVQAELSRGGRTIVIAHSLGSVVAYDLLRDAKTLDVPLFLTVGSPLGIDAVRRHVKPVLHPASVGRWVNARDERDVVALYPLLGRHFASDPNPVDHSAVRNRSDNAHHINGYLNDARIAAEVATVLSA